MSEHYTYSDEIPGTERNYGWPVQFHKSTSRYVTITQTKDEGVEGVLLSPRQVKELIAFVQPVRGRRIAT